MGFRLVQKVKLLCPEMDISLCWNTSLSREYRQIGCLNTVLDRGSASQHFASVPLNKSHKDKTSTHLVFAQMETSCSWFPNNLQQNLLQRMHFWEKVEAQRSRHRVNKCKSLVLKSICYWHPPPRNYPAHLCLPLFEIGSKGGLQPSKVRKGVAQEGTERFLKLNILIWSTSSLFSLQTFPPFAACFTASSLAVPSSPSLASRADQPSDKGLTR